MFFSLGIQELSVVVNGKILSQHEESFSRICTDSREDVLGKLFIPLVGKRFDAHIFLKVVSQRNAAVVLAHDKDQAEIAKNYCSTILVKDTLQALQDLASFWRNQCSGKVIGITGSNGKTTTKDFLKKILSADSTVTASKGSFNNHWGVPLTLLQAQKNDKFIIVEMGMSRKGELADLSKIARPDLVLVTKVACAHLEFLKDISVVSEAKEEIYSSNPKSTFVFNKDDEYTKKMYEKYKNENSFYFSKFCDKAHVQMRLKSTSFRGLSIEGRVGDLKFSSLVPIFGAYNLQNIMAASTLSLALGVSPSVICKNLRYLQTSQMRGQWHIFEESGAKVLFDAYNANPDSMKSFVESAFDLQTKGQRFFILGEMLELGESSKKLHEDLARLMALKNPSGICFIGSKASDFKAALELENFKNELIISTGYKESLAIEMKNMLNPEDLLFIKGSRALRLEQFLETWKLGNIDKN